MFGVDVLRTTGELSFNGIPVIDSIADSSGEVAADWLFSRFFWPMFHLSFPFLSFMVVALAVVFGILTIDCRHQQQPLKYNQKLTQQRPHEYTNMVVLGKSREGFEL